MATAAPHPHQLHPHSTTHSQNGSPLPALHMPMRSAAGHVAHGGGGNGGVARSLESSLCFSPRDLATGSFDAHAFVSRCLSAPNPAFISASGSGSASASPDDPEAAADAAISTRAAALLQREAGGSGGGVVDDDSSLLSLSEHGSSPSLPLELLRDHLTRYQLYVKGELVELLNAEYARFIGLSSSLSGLDTSIGAIRSLLSALAQHLDALHRRMNEEALQPFQHKLMAQYAQEKNKQTYLHMVAHVLAHIKSLAALLAHEDELQQQQSGPEEESRRAESKQKEQADGGAPTHVVIATSPAQQRLVAHHLSTSYTRHQQRAAELKQQRRADAARGLDRGSGARRRTGGSNTQGAYADLKLDIPAWMLRQYAGGGGAASHHDDEESDDESGLDDDEDEDGEGAAGDEDDVPAADEDGADAFALYEALLAHPSLSSAAPAEPASPTSCSAALVSLRARLVRVERACATMSTLRSLLPLCSHFHLVRDLCAADGVSGPFDLLQAKLRDQSRACFADALRILAEEYEKQVHEEQGGTTPTTTTPTAAVTPVLSEARFSPELVSLLRSSLRALTFLDVRTEAEEMVRTTLVRPMLQRRVQAAMPALRAAHALDEEQYWDQYGDTTAGEEDGGSSSSPPAPHPLRSLYAHLLHFLRGPVRLLMDACAGGDVVPSLSPLALQSGCVVPPASAPDSPSSLGCPLLLPFSFLSASFFAEVVSYLSTEVGSALFSSGLPHVFLAHFHATKSFLAAIESFAVELLDPASASSASASASIAESPSVASLHAHPSWVSFDKRWNVGIYFQLRFQSIAAGVESAAVQAASASNRAGAAEALLERPRGKGLPSPLPKSDPHSTIVPPFVAVQSCGDCFHMGATTALWRSLCACFSPRIFLGEAAPRFLKLALQCLARYAKLAEEVGAAAGGATHAGGTAGLGSQQEPEARLLLLIADVQRLLQLLSSHWIPLVARVLGVRHATPQQVQNALRGEQQQGSEDDALLGVICDAFAPSLARLAALSSSASTQLAELLLSRCTPALSYVSRIKPAYRFSRQPTHALQYVRAMLQPVTRVAHALHAGDVRVLLGVEGDGTGAGGALAGGEMDVNEGMADDANDTAALPSLPAAAPCGPLLDADARATLLRDVLGRLSGAYAAEAAKVLSGDIFGELSKKLNKRTAAAAAIVSGAGGSEVDKTRRQLHLDATLFARIIREQIGARDADAIVQPLLQATQLNASA